MGFDTVPGRVLIVDNELHEETLAHRIPKVADAQGVPKELVHRDVCLAVLRGRLEDILALENYFLSLRAERFKLIVLDAFYRFLPENTDENDNGTMARIYNQLDSYARAIGCAFVCIHHTTKGTQAGKAITDVGAGAGAQSRAADTHLILRPHEEEGAVVLGAAVRSWPPPEPICLRWDYPIWHEASDLEPDALRDERRRKKREAPQKGASSEKPKWTVDGFVTQFVESEPQSKHLVLDRAESEELSLNRAKHLLKTAEAKKLIFRWTMGPSESPHFATVPQPQEAEQEISRKEEARGEGGTHPLVPP